MVADRYCYGSFPGRQEIELSDTEDALTQVCRWYLQNTECPRQSALHRVKYRNDHVAQLVRDFRADGAIYEQMKFCTYWSYERVIASQVMPRDYGIQMLSIDRPYISGQSGQLRTRVQAFVESLEIKKLRTAQKEEKMAWYWIVLIVAAALFGLLFLAYMTNADMKLIEKLYDTLIKYHDSKTVEEKI